MREISRPNLSALTTLHLGGEAEVLLVPETREELPLVGRKAKGLGMPLYVLGRGSNFLAHDGDLPVVLASMRAFSEIKIIEEDEEKAILQAGAGAPLKRLLRFCLENGLSGLEGLVGIPGSVGGACAMNAGSFGVEIGAHILSLECLDGEKIKEVQASGLELGYRHLSVKNCQELPIVISATFTLTRKGKRAIFQSMNLKYFEKKSRQPLGVWSAGCAFKNPSGALSAGKLLDMAGYRGKSKGGMIFSAKHANFLVNQGSGTASQALELMEEAIDAVKAMSGITLEPEVRFIPCR